MQVARDLSKIGVLLIGVALIVIAAIIVHFYITYAIPQISRPWPTSQFYAYCRHKTIVIHADRDLTDIRVLDNRSNQLCLIEKIPAGSEEICPVESYGMYLVQVGDYKRVVECIEEKAMVPVIVPD
ncbi:MAG: hypothetical protein L2C94_006510 [Aigarchaeota archaeon]|nr:hypothetical protein [Candidatus Wolframiiraptor gerlachensis]